MNNQFTQSTLNGEQKVIPLTPMLPENPKLQWPPLEFDMSPR